MQNQQEKTIAFLGEHSLKNAVIAKLCEGKEAGIINIDGWKIRAVSPNNAASSKNPDAIVHCENIKNVPTFIKQIRLLYPDTKIFLITQRALLPQEKQALKHAEISCLNAKNPEAILVALQEYISGQEFGMAFSLIETRKITAFIPESLDLISITKTAIENWANKQAYIQSTYKKKVEEGQKMLMSVSHNKDPRQRHMALLQFLKGNEENTLTGLKYFLLSQLGKTKALTDKQCAHDIEHAIMELDQYICKELDFIKKSLKVNHSRVDVYLDKKLVTKQRMQRAYKNCSHMVTTPELFISDENYMMQFRRIIRNNNSFAYAMIGHIWNILPLDAIEVRQSLYDAFRFQNIADPLCDLRVLKPDYWKAVCEELDNMDCPRQWAQVKFEMAHVFNDEHTEWLYFPKKRFALLKEIRDDLDVFHYSPHNQAPKLRYLLDVLESDIELDGKSFKILKRDKNSIRTLYEKACMNKLRNLAEGLSRYVDLRTTAFNMNDNIFNDDFIQEKLPHLNYQALLTTDNHELLRLHMDAGCLSSKSQWLDWSAKAMINEYSNVAKVLNADNISRQRFERRVFKTEDMEKTFHDTSDAAVSLLKVRSLCSIQESWLILIMNLMCTTENLYKSHIAMLFMMLTETRLGTTLNDEEFSTRLEKSWLSERYGKNRKAVLEETVHHAKTALCWEKYGLFKMISPLPKEVNTIIMDKMANEHSGLDLDDKQILSCVPDYGRFGSFW